MEKRRYNPSGTGEDTMNIGVLGTGMVGRALSARLVELGHEVVMGTRDPARTLGRAESQGGGDLPFRAWQEHNQKVQLAAFAGAAMHGELIINATNGDGSLPALNAGGKENLYGKTLMDISNPLDFSTGMPPSLFISNTDSLGEQIQRAFPDVKVGKTLNTVNCRVMVHPGYLAESDHTVFVSGNDAQAKAAVAELLRAFGWKDILDLGDITTARGPEMLLAIWLRLWAPLQTPMFNFKVVR
jgi:8-hydroxy-5-deazaflavin:NADPH oxidoreductase